MSLSGHFSSKHVKLDKLGREIRTIKDFRSAIIREPDGSYKEWWRGMQVSGSPKETPLINDKKPKKDVAGGESKFYKATPISTIVQKTKDDEEAAGETETGLRAKKKVDVNARAYKL